MSRGSAVALFCGALLPFLPSSALADADFDVAAWAMDLDPDRPASGPHVVYTGSEAPAAETAAALRTALFTQDPRVAELAARSLVDYGVPHGESPLLDLARSERWDALDESVRSAVLSALRHMRSGRALPIYARVALRESDRAAREAIRALCESMAPEALPVLRALAGGPDGRKRNLVVRFLRKAGEREAAREALRLRKEARIERRQERRDEKREQREDRKRR